MEISTSSIKKIFLAFLVLMTLASFLASCTRDIDRMPEDTKQKIAELDQEIETPYGQDIYCFYPHASGFGSWFSAKLRQNQNLEFIAMTSYVLEGNTIGYHVIFRFGEKTNKQEECFTEKQKTANLFLKKIHSLREKNKSKKSQHSPN